jgi:hypothetical protein
VNASGAGWHSIGNRVPLLFRSCHSRGQIQWFGQTSLRDSENKPELGLSGDLALSCVDRQNFAVSQGFDVPHGWLAEEPAVFAIELAGTFVSDLKRRTCGI